MQVAMLELEKFENWSLLQELNSFVYKQNVLLKYQGSTTSGCNGVRIRKLEFVATILQFFKIISTNYF